MNQNSPPLSPAGGHSKNFVADDGSAQGTPSADDWNASGPGRRHTQADTEGGAHESRALALYRRQMLALKPEVIIEIPPPVRKRRRIVWLGAAVVPLTITLLALSLLAIRSQRISTAEQEATVEARVAIRLTEEWANRPQLAADASQEATVEARVAIRLTATWATLSHQPTPLASAVDKPTESPTIDDAGSRLVADESDVVFGRASFSLNLRRGPGENYPPLKIIHAGEQLRLLGRTEDSLWFLVSRIDGFPADEGWVAGWLVNIPVDRDLSYLAVVPPPPLATQNE